LVDRYVLLSEVPPSN